MIVLGVLFVLAAIGVGAGVLLDNGEAVSLQWYGLTLDGFSTLSTYVAGLVTMLVLLVGLWLVRRGLGRNRGSGERRTTSVATTDRA
jgi:membrane protein implicated in regulation of membrane protease activity